MNNFVKAQKAEEFLYSLPNESVDLFLIDPPYFGIVDDTWDNQWKDETAYVDWLVNLVKLTSNFVKPTGSVLMFGGIGKHGSHPLFKVMNAIETSAHCGDAPYFFRNMITWKKRRAYGKSHDYLFCREEVVWYSASAERTHVTFNVPYLDVKRGYEGFNKKYPAKSEYKRVSNVWDDIPELMRPKRSCQKPLPLLERLIQTHSNPGDLVVDFFAGTGSTGVAALQLGRKFLGCEADPVVAETADKDCMIASTTHAQTLAETEKCE